MPKYQLWKVTYAFEVPADAPADFLHMEHYVVAARNEFEAIYKAESCLLKNPAFKSLKLTINDVKVNVREHPKPKIKFPLLSLEDDQFGIGARISKDGKSLEFIVNKK